MTLAPPDIEHRRDLIYDDDGKEVAQIYNHLIYSFGKPTQLVARAYLDTPDSVAIMQSGVIPDDLMDYLKDRFWVIEQLGRDGYKVIWQYD
ncbi:hypothetical protein [Sphingobium sp. Leaf26]|uniref:hypothetical protein n=1 Tax=Sphingobium sp. Leaf26 TaxID=1735693 RepID=UPI000A41758A|nr:hypothetical protein [Sphingobium sp. Leaf26]